MSELVDAAIAMGKAEVAYNEAKAAYFEVEAKVNGYRIALRPDFDDTDLLDDVVVNDVSCFRAEDMGDWWWMCCYLADTDDGHGGEDRITFSVRKNGYRGPVVMTVGELPSNPTITYEPIQTFGSEIVSVPPSADAVTGHPLPAAGSSADASVSSAGTGTPRPVSGHQERKEEGE